LQAWPETRCGLVTLGYRFPPATIQYSEDLFVERGITVSPMAGAFLVRSMRVAFGVKRPIADDEGKVLDIPVQARWGTDVARRLMRKRLTNRRYSHFDRH
jgi:hypothetical protein